MACPIAPVIVGSLTSLARASAAQDEVVQPLDRRHAPPEKHAGGPPEPDIAVMGGLKTDDPLVPERIMGEADILNLEFLLPGFPFDRPSQMRFVELLTKF